MGQLRFENLTGQSAAVSRLQDALQSGRSAQSWIICGERGSGKRDLALTYAAALMCPDLRREKGILEPCGVCRSCRRIAAGTHPDVIEVTNERAGVRTKTGIIGVKTARMVQTDVSIRPYEGPHKIYVIPDAHCMNAQAQNALLKTLEEPPAYAVFLLLAENTAAFLPTVLSRCAVLRLQPVPEQDLLRMLEREGVTGTQAVTAARLSHGNPGRCRELACSEEAKALRSEATELLRRMPETDAREIVVFAEKLAADKKTEGNRSCTAEDFLDLGRSWFLDVLTYRACGAQSANRLIFQDDVQYISKIAGRMSPASLEAVFRAFDEADRSRAAKEGDVQTLEVLLLQIRRAMSFVRRA